MPEPINDPVTPNRKRVTLSDVARHVGVGPMTVSRALRTPEMVSLHLRGRILKAVDELGYVRNRVASGLASGTARLVPVIIPTLHHSVYVPFLEGLYSVLPQAGYQILLGTTEYLIDQEGGTSRQCPAGMVPGRLIAIRGRSFGAYSQDVRTWADSGSRGDGHQ